MEIIHVFLTALLSVTSLFIIAKLMGHKQISQLDFFDYISGITIGSIAAEMATELEKPWKPLIAIAVYGGVSVLISFVMSKCPKTRKYINGSPTVIMNNGKLYRKNMKKSKLDLSEFMALCRQEGYFHLEEIQTAVFEYNGKVTFLPKSEKRPVVPSDMNIFTVPDSLDAELIMDGRVMGENLKRMGLDEVWLKKQLEAQGYKSVKEIFLGMCSSELKLTLFANE